MQHYNRSVSCTGNRYPIPGHRAPAVTMIGWHGTARHWAAGDGGLATLNGD